MKNLKLLMMFLAVAAMTACGDKGTDEPKIEVKDGTYIGTVIVDKDGDNEFKKDDVSIEFSFNDDKTVNIKMVKVSFSKNMVDKDGKLIEIDVTIPGVTAKKTETGYSLSANNIIPLAMGGEFSAYTIKNLTGSVTPENISLDMMCGTFPLTFSGTAKTE